MIKLDSEYLMMVEPTRGAEPAIDDEITALARRALAEAEIAQYMTKGLHVCVCGALSDNKIRHIGGMETNSLLVHYVEKHRSEVPSSEIEKLKNLFR